MRSTRSLLSLNLTAVSTLLFVATPALAQYPSVGLGRYPGAPCVGNYQSGCLRPDGARPYVPGRPPEPPSADWRLNRERQLEDSQRTSADRDRDYNNWRIQRERGLEDRYGKSVEPPVKGTPRMRSDSDPTTTKTGARIELAPPWKPQTNCIPRPGEDEKCQPVRR